MPTDTDVDLIINELKKAQYETSTKDPNQLYMVTDDDHYATSEQLNELDASKQDVIDSSHKLSADLVSDGTTNKVVTQTEKTTWNNKQDALVSGTNIKTINSTSILGSGNISVATAAQGTKADTAVQNLGDLGITATATELNYTDGVTSNIQTQLDGKQPNLPTGTTGYYLQKTESGVQWSEVQSAPPIDNKSITKNSGQQLQAEGVIDQGDTSVAIKEHRCTRAEYEAMASHDLNTKYIITDDTDLSLPILQALYPVGSCFMTFNATCPLANLFGTWQNIGTKLLMDISGSYSVPIKGNGLGVGLKGIGSSGDVYASFYENSNEYASMAQDGYGKEIGTSVTQHGAFSNSTVIGITDDPTKSGIIADISNSLTKSHLTINIFRRTA